MLLVFATIGYDQRVLLGSIQAVIPSVPLVGCSGEGVLSHRFADESSYSVGIMAIASDQMRVHTGLSEGLEGHSEEVGRDIGKQILPQVDSTTKALILFPDGLHSNFDRLVAGLYETVPAMRSLPLVGGFAGENFSLEKTYQYWGDKVTTNGVSFALISGALSMTVAANHGSVPIGTDREITACAGNVILEIDGQPALQVLREYIDAASSADWGRAMAPLALGFPAPNHLASEDEVILRFMPQRDEAVGSVTIPTEVEKGQTFRMTRRDLERIEQGAKGAAEKLKKGLADRTPAFVLQFDCGGRGKLVMRETDKLRIQQGMQSLFAEGVPWLGFYTYGEIGPVNQVNSFHNYTVVLAAFY